jgi:Outer membrane receptor proteins, mostly Fe transport
VEFSIPLHRTFKATLAGRYDKYDDITDVNDARTWNAGLEWRPVDSLLFRGSYATSFKAPDMHWVFSEGSGSFGNSVDVLRCIAANANPNCSGYSYSMYTVTAGDPSLTEETGKSWGAGVVWDITDDWSVSVDYWDIRLNGAIRRVSTSDVLNDEAGCVTGKRLDGSAFEFAPGSAYCQALLGLITRVPEAGEQYGRVSQITSGPINQSFLRVAGIDGSMQYRLKTDRFGRYAFRMDWSHTLKSERQIRPSDPVDSQWRDNPTNLDFRSKAKASVNWGQGDWSANLSTVRYGSLPKYVSGAGRTPALQLWNANIGWQFSKKAELRFYANNLFNKLHPRDVTNSAFPYFYEAYSPVGREVALQFKYKFD